MEPDARAYFEHTITVAPEDLDELEHVNNAVYLSYVEACGRGHSEREGLTLDVFRAHGAVPIIRRHEITYYRPAKLGDTLSVSTHITQLGGPRGLRHNEVRLHPSGDLVAEVDTEWVWIEPRSGRPKRVPQAILQAFGF
ncbi:thioesterase family protein [soil metagenome]